MAFPTVQELKSPSALAATTPGASLRVAGLFAGIGGIELGLHGAGHRTELLCEIEPAAQEVLRIHFPGIELVPDVCELTDLPKVDLVAAGFPCQDLSQAGRTVGIGGARSGLVGQVFRLLERSDPTWLLLENVPFMLQLDRGHAMRHVTDELGRLGFRWAYRVVDARAFGVPQRRQRVILLASRREDPRWVLFGDDAGERADSDHRGLACGFYWTEGLRGLGWAVDAVPTLKGGSTIGIPSPPAVWMPEGLVGTPHIGDAERLQGFDEGWTAGSVSRCHAPRPMSTSSCCSGQTPGRGQPGERRHVHFASTCRAGRSHGQRHTFEITSTTGSLRSPFEPATASCPERSAHRCASPMGCSRPSVCTCRR